MQVDNADDNVNDLPIISKEQEVIAKIETLIKTIVENLVKTNSCTLQTPTGAVRFQAQSSLSFVRLLSVLNTAHYMLTEKKHIRKRDLYYSDVELFSNPKISSATLDRVSSLLQVPRNSLNILAAERGIAYGDLRYTYNGGLVDCKIYGNAGKSIPSSVEGIKDVASNARFVLVVEKESSLLRLSDDNFCEQHGPCILITAKGNPDIGTRLFTKRILRELGIPVFYLGDWDPFGIGILLTYCAGSMKGLRRYEGSELNIPNIIWLGPTHADLSKVSKTCFLPLSDEDKKKAKSVMEHPALADRPEWKAELEHMLATDTKAEIQALSSISLSYLSSEYPKQHLSS